MTAGPPKGENSKLAPERVPPPAAAKAAAVQAAASEEQEWPPRAPTCPVMAAAPGKGPPQDVSTKTSQNAGPTAALHLTPSIPKAAHEAVQKSEPTVRFKYGLPCAMELPYVPVPQAKLYTTGPPFPRMSPPEPPSGSSPEVPPCLRGTKI